MMYFDSAATALLKPESVAKAVYEAIGQAGNSSRGAHAASLYAMRIVYETRERIAALFGCLRPEQVAFTANSTMALNIAIKGSLKPGEHVITTAWEHNSVLRPLYELEEQGVALTILPSDAEGNLDIASFETAIRPNTKAIVCTHASNLTGNCMNIARVGGLCRQYGLRFILDASQTAGVFPIDMEKDNIDIVCFTGHKSLFGPQGTGGLCLRAGCMVEPLFSGGSGSETFSHRQPAAMPARLEAGTINVHGLAGLQAGLRYIEAVGIDAIRKCQQQLMFRFYNGILDLPEVKVYGDFSDRNRAAIVTLNIGREASGSVADALAVEHDIAVRAGGHCAPLLHLAMGTAAQGAVRFSFSHFNTEAEIDAAIAAVRKIAAE